MEEPQSILRRGGSFDAADSDRLRTSHLAAKRGGGERKEPLADDYVASSHCPEDLLAALAASPSLTALTYARRIVSGDLNGDGWPDIAVAVAIRSGWRGWPAAAKFRRRCRRLRMYFWRVLGDKGGTCWSR